jgi:signal recognition particle GTPase
MSSEIIQEFIQALDEEIDAIKKGKGGSIVKISNGRFIGKKSDYFLYVFNLESFISVLDESPAEIEIRGNNYQATIYSTQNMEVEIGIKNFFEQFISEAKLKTNLWYLLEILKNKFIEYQKGSLKVDFHIGEALFKNKNLGSESIGNNEIRYSQTEIYLNDAQKKAIEASFSSKLSIIWGPPGTGKTTTIAKAIEAHLNAGRRILLRSEERRVGKECTG